MKQILFGMLATLVTVATSTASAATLPRNPWGTTTVQTQSGSTALTSTTTVGQDAQQNVVYVRIDQGSQPIQAVYEGGADNIWNTPMPEFTGRLTTWGDGYGQVPNAPEVNMHNILSITQHLRNMGYNIPDSLEARIKAAPAATKQKILGALSDVRRAKDPASKSAVKAMNMFESETGLDVDNLLGNSLDLLSKK